MPKIAPVFVQLNDFIFQENFFLTSLSNCDIIVKSQGNVPVAQLDRVTGYEPVGRGFEPLQARHIFSKHASACFFYAKFYLNLSKPCPQAKSSRRYWESPRSARFPPPYGENASADRPSHDPTAQTLPSESARQPPHR